MFPNYFNQLIEVILREWKMLSLLCTVIFLYYHYTSTFKFFEKKNVKYLKPRFLIGNLGQRLLLKISLHDYQKQIYNEFKGHKCGGEFTYASILCNKFHLLTDFEKRRRFSKYVPSYLLTY